MILEVFADHNRKMEALVGKDYADGTLERYETSLDHTKAFIQWQYLVNDLYIRKLDHFFIEQYAFWLKTVRNCNHNTTMKYLSNFKKIVLICVKNKWLPGDPFTNFKMTEALKKANVPARAAEISIGFALAQGELDMVSNDLSTLLKRQPVSLKEYLKHYYQQLY
ncbi:MULTISPECIES: phage integrase SAM-like domain-containing protein [Chitinophagaceae]